MGNLVAELETLPVSSMLKMEGKESTVTASITFYELYQASGSSSWVRQGKHSRGLVLNRNIFLLRLPLEEGGKYFWLKLAPHKKTSNLRAFYKGGDSPGEWGPARRFAKQNQSGEVRYQLFETQWIVKDIGKFEVVSDGETTWMTSGDQLYFVTSQSTQDQRWLIYLDARPGEAQGTGGAFVGEAFNPSETVEEVL